MVDEFVKNTRTPIRCRCERRAVERPPSLLRKVVCIQCGKTFRSNRENEVCFECEKKNSN